MWVSTVFSAHRVWAERDACHEYNSLIVQRVDLSDRHWAASAEQFSLWPRAARLSHDLGVLHRDSARRCPVYDSDLVCFRDRGDVSGILSTCPVEIALDQFLTIKKMNAAVSCLD